MESLVCTIEQGILKGQNENDIQGTPFLSFMGIPYAKPPLGNLRFKAPQSPDPWEGIRDATKHGNPCHALQLLPTPESLLLKPLGSEDCLFLNVYTRRLNKDDNDLLKPVMMYIHGGAFIAGSGDRSMYGPEFLMTEDIVLVTINYRLGALGFLTIDDPTLGVTGNAGLKDQIQALKWIQRNIKQFCGDPNNVTIFGESAGGASVHYLVLSPLAEGLFHKAIIQSASVLCPWSRGQNNAKELARLCGCTVTDDKKILEFLQQLSVEQLLEGQVKMGDWLSPIRKRPFGPTIEPKIDGAFMFEEPSDLIKSGAYNHVPMIFGYTSQEGIFEEGTKFLGFQSNFEEFVPYYLGYPEDSEAFKQTNKTISKFYFGAEKADVSNKDALYTVLSDSIFLRGIHCAVKLHGESCQKPVYYYRMSIDTDLNLFKRMFHVNAKGVSHGDDLGYLFKIGDPVLKPGSVEERSVQRFVRMWTNFARTGNPIPEKDSLLNIDWKPITKTELNFLDIDRELVPGVDPDIDRMSFWDKLCEERTECY